MVKCTQTWVKVGFCVFLLTFTILTSEGIFSVPHALAQSSDPGLGKVTNIMAEVISSFVTALHALGLLALGLVEYFLRPEFLNNPGMMGPNGSLRIVWLFSRNVMNFIFAIMLIGVAFYTIIAGSKEKIQEYIKHFVLAVILVNFSWFFPRVILDVSNILTATVFSIPSMVLSGDQFECRTTDQKPCKIMVRASIFPDDQEVALCRAQDPETCQCYIGIICNYYEPFNAQTTQNRHALLSALAINYGRIANLTEVAQGNQAPATTVGDGLRIQYRFLLNAIFSLIFIIAMTFPLIALAAGMLLRILILWACIAFMPFTFINFVLQKGKLGGGLPGIENMDIWKHFVAAAFLPVLVAIPISVGFVMIMAGMAGTNASGFPLYISSNAPLISGIDNIWEFMWAFFAIAVIWIGAFTALKQSSIIGSVTERIKGAGQALGSYAIRAPLLTPLPAPAGRSLNIGQALGAAGFTRDFKAEGNAAENVQNRVRASEITASEAKAVSSSLKSEDIARISNMLRDRKYGEIRETVSATSGRDMRTLSDAQTIDLLQKSNASLETKFDDRLLSERMTEVQAKVASPQVATPAQAPEARVTITTQNDATFIINGRETVNAGDIRNQSDMIELARKMNVATSDSSESMVNLGKQGFEELANKNIAINGLSDRARRIAGAMTLPENRNKSVEQIIREVDVAS